MTPKGPARDPVLDALGQLLTSLHEGVGQLEVATRLATGMRDRRLDGDEYWEIEAAIDGPSVPDLITTNLLVLQAKGRRLRRAGARAMREEGLTLEEIAQLFGVSHQRVSALLREDEA